MKNNDLKKTIIFASVMVTIALLFNGFAYLKGSTASLGPSGATGLQDEIEKGIEAYIKKQEDSYKKSQAEANKPKTVTGDYSDDDAVLGDKNAKVTLIEWSDYECPFCKRHFTNTYSEIKKKYIDTGKVKLIFRDFPLSFHDPLATQEAIAAECVREQKGDKAYFQYHDLIFQTTSSNGSGLEKSKLYELATQVGADKTKFTKCLDDEKYKDEVKDDIKDGASAGVNGTPAFLINNRLLTGAQPFSAFEKIIEEELKK